MPHVINGIGTWYYGKRNIYQYQGMCRFCRKDATLISYDTTLYFVFFMVPIIPLGKRRILDQCSACRKHSFLTMKEWEEKKGKAYSEKIAQYHLNPRDVAAAQDALKTCASFQDKEEFLKLAQEVMQNLNDDAETMQLTGAIAGQFGCYKEAEDALRTALAVKDEPDTREALAVCLIRSMRPDEALPYLQHIIDEEIPDRVNHLTFLARGYQAVGEHRKALDLLNKITAIVPFITKDKQYIKIRKLSEKNLSSGKRLKVGELAAGAVKVAAGKGIGGILARLIAPAILLLLLGIYFFISFAQGRNREVYLINGLSKPYMVRVNGSLHDLPSMRPVLVKIPEGLIEITVDDTSLSIPPQKHIIKTSFLSRPFLRKTFLINPDTVAPIYWEQVFYAPEGKPAPEGRHILYVGEPLYIFDRINFVFVPFPEKITVSSKGVYSRTRISIPNVSDVFSIFSVLTALDERQPEKSIVIAKRHITYEPENIFYLDWLYKKIEPKAFIDAIHQGLTVRPVRITWHRFYQEAMEKADPNYDIEEEYRKLYEAESENPELQYLYGRAMKNTGEALQFFEKSIKGPKPCPYIYYSIAYIKLSTGKFDEALEMATKGKELLPGKEDISYLWRESLEAAGQYDRLIEDYDAELKKRPIDFYMLAEKIHFITIRDGAKKAEEALEQWLRSVRYYYGEKTVQSFRDYVSAEIAYCIGDLGKYESLKAKFTRPDILFRIALSTGKIEEAAGILQKTEDKNGYLSLLLYMAQANAGMIAEAGKTLARAVERISGQSWEERLIAECLAGKRTPDPDEICQLVFSSREKSILLAALCVRYPDQKVHYCDLAVRLNFSRRFPHHFLTSILKGKD